MDRPPERRQARVKPAHRGLIGEVKAGRDMDARIVAVRIFFEFGGDHVRHMAHRAGGAQRADDGGPQRAGPAGDHDIGVVISDHGFISRSARRRSRAAYITPGAAASPPDLSPTSAILAGQAIAPSAATISSVCAAATRRMISMPRTISSSAIEGTWIPARPAACSGR